MANGTKDRPRTVARARVWEGAVPSNGPTRPKKAKRFRSFSSMQDCEPALRGLSATELGARAEDIVRQDLLARGFSCAPKKSHSTNFDILATNPSGQQFQIEVRVASYNQKTGSLHLIHRRRDKGRSCCYCAVVFKKHWLIYLGDLGETLDHHRISDIDDESWSSTHANVDRKRSLRIISSTMGSPKRKTA